jgi:GDP-L-fucose synthase
MIQASNQIHSAYLSGVKRLLFLGSSCIYPPSWHRSRAQSTTDRPAQTHQPPPYALAKIAGQKCAGFYNRQYGTHPVSGRDADQPVRPGRQPPPTHSHVIPALLLSSTKRQARRKPRSPMWGLGTPRREFLYSDDMADACVCHSDEARRSALPGAAGRR